MAISKGAPPRAEPGGEDVDDRSFPPKYTAPARADAETSATCNRYVPTGLGITMISTLPPTSTKVCGRLFQRFVNRRLQVEHE